MILLSEIKFNIRPKVCKNKLLKSKILDNHFDFRVLLQRFFHQTQQLLQNGDGKVLVLIDLFDVVDDVEILLLTELLQDLEALGKAEAGQVEGQDKEPGCNRGPKENAMSLHLTGVEVIENVVIVDQSVDCVRVFFLPAEQGEDQINPEPEGVRVRRVAPTGVQVGRDHHDVHDVLEDHESVSRTRKQGQAGHEEDGHADDGHVAQQLQELNEDAKKNGGTHFFDGKCFEGKLVNNLNC